MRGSPEVQDVCVLNELPAPSGRAFTVTVGDVCLDAFIIHWQENVYAYLNRCPHTSTLSM